MPAAGSPAGPRRRVGWWLVALLAAGLAMAATARDATALRLWWGGVLAALALAALGLRGADALLRGPRWWRRLAGVLLGAVALLPATIAVLVAAELVVPDLRPGARAIGLTGLEPSGALRGMPWGAPDEEAWRADLDELAAALRRRHPALTDGALPAAYREADRRLRAELPGLAASAMPLRVAALVATLGDAHTRVPLPQPAATAPQLPLEWYDFDDGLVVVGAPRGHAAIVGARVLQIGGLPAPKAMRGAGALVSAENEGWRRARAPSLLLRSDVLALLGARQVAGAVTLRVELADGTRRDVEVELVPPVVGLVALHLPVPVGSPPQRGALRRKPYAAWREGDVLRVEVSAMTRGGPDGGWEGFLARIGRREDPPPARAVVDLRACTGGDNQLATSLLEALDGRGLTLPGKLYVLVGRRTFSACNNLASAFERLTPAWLVGEPTGNRPNQYGDAEPLVLPRTRLLVQVSSRFWQHGLPNDPRDAVEPDLFVRELAADYRAGRDATLAAGLAHRQPPPGPGGAQPAVLGIEEPGPATGCRGSFRLGALLRVDLRPHRSGAYLLGRDSAPFLWADFRSTPEGGLIGVVPGRRLVCPSLPGGEVRLEWEGAEVVLAPIEETHRLPLQRLVDGDLAAAASSLRALPPAERTVDSRLELYLNQVGYERMQRGDKAGALEAMTLNAELFPRSPNTWDSLGEVQLAEGRRAAAVRSYRRAVELVPTWRSARAALDRLR